MKTGVPQGSTLRPLLFLIYINDFPLVLEKVKGSIFADDVTLVGTGADIKVAETKMNQDLERVNHCKPLEDGK